MATGYLFECDVSDRLRAKRHRGHGKQFGSSHRVANANTACDAIDELQPEARDKPSTLISSTYLTGTLRCRT
jgi:hypothetical protein